MQEMYAGNLHGLEMKDVLHIRPGTGEFLYSSLTASFHFCYLCLSDMNNFQIK